MSRFGGDLHCLNALVYSSSIIIQLQYPLGFYVLGMMTGRAHCNPQKFTYSILGVPELNSEQLSLPEVISLFIFLQLISRKKADQKNGRRL